MEGKRRGTGSFPWDNLFEQRGSQCQSQRESLEMSPEAQASTGFLLEARHVLWGDKAFV